MLPGLAPGSYVTSGGCHQFSRWRGADRSQYRNPPARELPVLGGRLARRSAAGGAQDPPQGGESQEALEAAVDEAAAFGAYVAAHAHGKEGVLRAVRAGVRSIEHGTLIDEETLSIMKEHGTFYVPTTDIICRHIAKNPADESPRGQTMRQLDSSATAALQLAIKMKIPIGYGTDSGAPSHGTNARQLGQFVANGMTPIQAVRTPSSPTPCSRTKATSSAGTTAATFSRPAMGPDVRLGATTRRTSP